MDSRLRACDKIEIADFGETPQRHSREGGNPCVNNALACGELGPRLRGDDAGAVNNYARRYQT